MRMLALGIVAAVTFWQVPMPVLGGEMTDAERARQIIESRKQEKMRAEEQIERAFAAVRQTEMWTDFQFNKTHCERVAAVLADGDALMRMGPQQFGNLRIEQQDCKARHAELWKQIESIVRELATEFAREDLKNNR